MKFGVVGGLHIITVVPVVPVSYREKIRFGRSEIKFFFEYFFHGFGVFLLGRFAVEFRHQY
jgi:hypothetical protein